MLDPGAFASILREPDHPQWRAAFDRLLSIFRGYLRGGRRWARVQESAVAADHDLTEELAHDFWLSLRDNPGLLDAAAVRGWGAVGWQVVRFLRTPTLKSVEVSESRLREHLASKIRLVLRRGDFREFRRNYWGVPGVPELTAGAEQVERARREQPPLPSNWSPQRSNQDPPIAGLDELESHLKAVVALAGAFVWIGDLCDMCWQALTPPLAASGPHLRSAFDVDHVPIRDEHRDFELPVLLQRYFDALDAETLAFARLAYGECGASVREIEERTGTSKTSVSRKLKSFRDGFAAYLESNGYDARDTAALTAALRDILGS